MKIYIYVKILDFPKDQLPCNEEQISFILKETLKVPSLIFFIY